MSRFPYEEAQRTRAVQALLDQGFSLSDLPLISPDAIKTMKASRERLDRGRAQRDLVVRGSITDAIERAKQIVQSHPGDQAALLEVTIALIACVSPHFIGQSRYQLFGGDDVGEQQVDDGLLPALDQAQSVLKVVHPVAPAEIGDGVNGGGVA